MARFPSAALATSARFQTKLKRDARPAITSVATTWGAETERLEAQGALIGAILFPLLSALLFA